LLGLFEVNDGRAVASERQSRTITHPMDAVVLCCTATPRRRAASRLGWAGPTARWRAGSSGILARCAATGGETSAGQSAAASRELRSVSADGPAHSRNAMAIIVGHLTIKSYRDLIPESWSAPCWNASEIL